MHDDGWRLRYNHGVTRRCNSVLACEPGHDPLGRKIDRAEAFYRARGLRPRFQITAASGPPALTGALERRGYAREDGALVLAAPTAALAAAPVRPGRAVVEAAPTAAWLAVLGEGSGEGEAAIAVRNATLSALELPAAFVTAEVDGTPAAVGLGVASDGYLIVFNMATAPAWRRHGAASRVLAELGAWGAARGLDLALLQVAPANAGARGLYAAAGFAAHHVYTYWFAPS